MKYSYSWLKELSGTKKTPEKVVEDLTMHSFEIEGIEKVGNANLRSIVVGKILEISKHPNADKLQLTKVNVGTGRDLSIVCGARNIKTGDKVPVALVGTKLPNSMEIREVEIRGQKSFGMLCAEDELGLGKDHSGIIILPKNAKVGESVEKYLGFDDTIIEIKVLPDRAHDALSHVGVAREISALEGKKMEYDFDGLKLPVGTQFIASKKQKRARLIASLQIQIKDKNLCPRYIGAVMTNVKITQSPKWMKDRLEASGMNEINNVVDATNYVMLELGQPLHAFDAEKIKTNKIVIRTAKNNEIINLLDKGSIKLTGEDLLITDGQNPLALAGIKGGLNSGITENTKTIILEAANFNAANIRKTRTRLELRTESSDRFEKDIDPNLAEKAMVRVIEILEHIAGGKLEEIVDIYPKPVRPSKIKLDLSYVGSLLGETIPAKDIIKILNLLNIKTEAAKALRASRSGLARRLLEPTVLVCTIPTFRIDLKTQEDLIEEIGRVYGYEKIKPAAIVEAIVPPKINEQIFFESDARNIMAGLGFSEVYNYSFYSQKDADICGLSNIKHLELANPMNPDQQLVRVSLIPNILKNIRENIKNFSYFRIFEVGRVYINCHSRESGNLVTGSRVKPGMTVLEKRIMAMAEILKNDSDAGAFYSMKGFVDAYLASFNVKNYFYKTFEPSSKSNSVTTWHPGRVAEIRIKETDEKIGTIGEINPMVGSAYKIKKRVAMAIFDLEILRKYATKDKIYEPIRKFPVVTRDISLLDKNNLAVAEISNFIKKAGGSLVLSVELFDTFQKDNITSHAFHINLGADRTLEGKEVDGVMRKIIDGLERELKVEIRK